jgi:hypothetical protein
MTTRRAECSCGQLAAVCEGEPLVAVCHCLACKRRSGSAFGLGAWYRKRDVTVSGNSAEFVRIGDEGGHIRHAFCPVCGVTLCWTIDGFPGIAVAAGTFSDMTLPPPVVSVYHASRGYPWIELTADPLEKRG